MNKGKIASAIIEAQKLAEDYQEGVIVVQLTPNNRRLLISHQIGNSWESMGLNAHDSEVRIVHSFDCRDFEPQYEYGEEKTKEHRLDSNESDYEEFANLVETVDEQVRGIIEK